MKNTLRNTNGVFMGRNHPKKNIDITLTTVVNSTKAETSRGTQKKIK